jgi:hypothetical protein
MGKFMVVHPLDAKHVGDTFEHEGEMIEVRRSEACPRQKAYVVDPDALREPLPEWQWDGQP